MKILKALFVWLTLCLADCHHEKLVDYVGEVVKTWNKRHSNRNDVVILNLGHDDDLVNDLVKSISGDNAIVFPMNKNSLLGKPSFTVVVSPITNPNELVSKLFYAVDEDFWSDNVRDNANLIFIPSGKSKVTTQNLFGIFTWFLSFMFLNAAVIYEQNGIQTKVFDILTRKVLQYDETTDVDVLFPDRLRNMKGFEYRVLALGQPPRISFNGVEWKGPDKLFMDVATKLQNASYSIQTFKPADKGSSNLFFKLMDDGVVDIFLNTVHLSETGYRNREGLKTVNTFDSVGYCALVPAPSRLSYLKFLLTPFDAYIWIYFLSAVAIFAAVWNIFKSRSTSRDFDSAGHFVFGMIALFFLQALPFRRNRPILTFVTQFFVFTMMILGNAYQSLLISLISEPHFGSKISTIDEMVERHQNYKADGVFQTMMISSNPYPSMILENIFYDNLIRGDGVEESAMNGTVFIFKCDVVEDIMSMSSSELLRTFYYILPQKFYSRYEKFLTSRFNPFNERLNEISLNVFETGIRQHWQTLSSSSSQGVIDMEQDNMLKLEDLVGVFYIYGFCLAIATVAFFLELLCYRWSERGAPFIMVKIGRFLGLTKRRRNPELNIGKVILEQINLDDLNELD